MCLLILLLVCFLFNGFDSFIISGSYGGHRRHKTDDGQRMMDNARGMA